MTIDRAYRRMNKALRLAQSGQADEVLAAAREILEARMKHTDSLSSPGAVRDYLRLLLNNREYEVFVVILLDAQHRVTLACLWALCRRVSSCVTPGTIAVLTYPRRQIDFAISCVESRA